MEEPCISVCVEYSWQYRRYSRYAFEQLARLEYGTQAARHLLATRFLDVRMSINFIVHSLIVLQVHANRASRLL
jgi:hypothetical protein